MRRKVSAIFVLLIFILVMTLEVNPIDQAQNLYHYYIEHFREDTGADNAVTAIYLNYRLFDTFFETLLLLVSVIGIIYFSRHEGDY